MLRAFDFTIWLGACALTAGACVFADWLSVAVGALACLLAIYPWYRRLRERIEVEVLERHQGAYRATQDWANRQYRELAIEFAGRTETANLQLGRAQAQIEASKQLLIEAESKLRHRRAPNGRFVSRADGPTIDHEH